MKIKIFGKGTGWFHYCHVRAGIGYAIEIVWEHKKMCYPSGALIVRTQMLNT